jgi:predicted acetylornithine/succinylornithine family transaminase
LLGVYGDRDFTVERGQGCHIWDNQGRRYLDCVSGVAVNALGHCHPGVVEAIREQSGRFIHASNLYLLPPQRELAQRLAELSGFDAVFFSNSGAEANEGAIKFARRHFAAAGQPERQEIITLAGSFHGRTYAAMAATGQEKIRQGFGPLPGGFRAVPCDAPEGLRAALGPNVAAVLFEPILAEGGVLELGPGMAEALAEAQSRGILLLADEIQTGLWRTGPFLAGEALGLRPDLVTLAKPLGGGLPLGAVLLRDAVAASLKPGDHGSTFGGNPVACAAGLAVLRVLSEPGFAGDFSERAGLLRSGVEAWARKWSRPKMVAGPLRGKGFLLGIPWGGDIPAFLKALRNEGVLAHRAGTDVLRLIPPLILSREEIRELLDALERAAAGFS